MIAILDQSNSRTCTSVDGHYGIFNVPFGCEHIIFVLWFPSSPRIVYRCTTTRKEYSKEHKTTFIVF